MSFHRSLIPTVLLKMLLQMADSLSSIARITPRTCYNLYNIVCSTLGIGGFKAGVSSYHMFFKVIMILHRSFSFLNELANLPVIHPCNSLNQLNFSYSSNWLQQAFGSKKMSCLDSEELKLLHSELSSETPSIAFKVI